VLFLDLFFLAIKISQENLIKLAIILQNRREIRSFHFSPSLNNFFAKECKANLTITTKDKKRKK